MSDQITKEQHYVPQMYLKRFTYDDEKQRCFVLNQKLEIYPNRINQICKKRYYYELKNKDGSIRNINFLEKQFFNHLETMADKHLEQICDFIDRNSKNTIVEQFPSAELVDFLALMINRNPHTIKIVPDIAQAMGIKIDCQNKNAALLFSLTQTPGLGKSLLDKYNIVLHSNKTITPFVTAEYPFVIISATSNPQHGFFYFPLSSEHLLILEPKLLVGTLPIRIINSDESFVNTVNNYMFQNLQDCELIIAKNRHVLEILKNKH